MNLFLKTIERDPNVHHSTPAHRFTNKQLLGLAHLFSIAVEEMWYITIVLNHCIATSAMTELFNWPTTATIPTFFHGVVSFILASASLFGFWNA